MCIIVNLIGKKFERLEVLCRSSRRAKDGKPLWYCRCSCGNTTTAKTVELTSSKKKSCGCLRLDCNTNYKHGHGSPKNKSREYRIWQGIIQRVKNPNAPAYKSYGGRGINICDEWKDFINFYNDMGDCPTDKHSIDRIDVNGNYEASNCRWVTAKEQQRNRSNNRVLEYKGKKMILIEWAEFLNTSPTCILSQLNRKSFIEVYEFYTKKMFT